MSRKAVIAISAVVAIVAAGAALLIAGVGTATADEVRFQNTADPGPDPFTEPTDVAAREGNGSREEKPKAGTFGGTGDDTVCDREKLIRALIADPQRLAAWAGTLGIPADAESVTAYIRRLRPVTLTQDTQVTNHSFSGGQARPFQAILQAGTAVLVDEDGKPVARCRCGNPLTEPIQLAKQVRCYQCPANYRPPPPCDYYDYDDAQYASYSDADFRRTYQVSDYRGKCYRPAARPPPVKKTKPTMPQTGEGANKAFEKCLNKKGSSLKCRQEYERVLAACNREIARGGNPSPACELYCSTEDVPPGQPPCKSSFDAARVALCEEDGGLLTEEECAAAESELQEDCATDPDQPGCEQVCEEEEATPDMPCPPEPGTGGAPEPDAEPDGGGIPEDQAPRPDDPGAGSPNGGGGFQQYATPERQDP